MTLDSRVRGNAIPLTQRPEPPRLLVSMLVSEAWLLVLAVQSALAGYALAEKAGLWRAFSAESDNFYLRLFFAFAGGLAANVTLIFALGVVGWLQAPALVGVGVACVALALISLKGRVFPLPVARGDFAIVVALYLIVALRAIQAPDYTDDTMFHLPAARFYADEHALALDPFFAFLCFRRIWRCCFRLASRCGRATSCSVKASPRCPPLSRRSD